MNLKELYQIAKTELSGLSSLDNSDFRLEQAEYKKEEEIWEIVVSYLVENTNKSISPLGALTSGFNYHRIYKKVKIDNDKSVIGFYIYEK
ncbi:hypothetical protein [Confluentibacter citreus]|uniref:hypothetical protein n=1 Tax=Confluentibacter citreus TaxID=2007307 RepID=UPI000C284101|nr:hypothetical protein [Confluentibacter citreus]